MRYLAVHIIFYLAAVFTPLGNLLLKQGVLTVQMLLSILW